MTTRKRMSSNRVQTIRILPLLLPIAILSALPSKSFAKSSTNCETVEECRANLERAKEIGREALERADEAEADEAEAIAQRDDAIEQRDGLRLELKKTRSDRDRLAGKFGLQTEELRRVRLELPEVKAERDVLRHELKRAKRQRWIWGVLGFVIGGGLVVGGAIAI